MTLASATEPTAAPVLDALVSVDEAAKIAGRCERTIRRAYRTGKLTAYRDGNGRGVHIRYGDLRDWMMARKAATAREQSLLIEKPIGQVQHRKRARGRSEPSENLTLLRAARQKRR